LILASDQLVRSFNAMNASRGERDDDANEPSVGEIRASLEKHMGDVRIEHNRIIRALVDGGHVREGDGFKAVSASASTKPGAVRPITVVQAARE
jgi:hypothetical protein